MEMRDYMFNNCQWIIKTTLRAKSDNLHILSASVVQRPEKKISQTEIDVRVQGVSAEINQTIYI